MNVSNFYHEIGGSYEDIINRLLSDSLVERFVLEFKEDKTFSQLVNAYESKNIENAFLAVHTLKGICGNLGFPRLEKAAIDLTEDLRKKTFENSFSDYKRVLDEYDSLIKAIDRNS